MSIATYVCQISYLLQRSLLERLHHQISFLDQTRVNMEELFIQLIEPKKYRNQDDVMVIFDVKKYYKCLVSVFIDCEIEFFFFKYVQRIQSCQYCGNGQLIQLFGNRLLPA